MKKRTGYLFKRNGIYYVAWKIDGKLFMKSTYTHDKREAEKKRAEIIAPFIVGDEAQSLESVSLKLHGKRNELAALEEKQNPPLSLAKAWDMYVKSPKRPDSGTRTLQDYRSYFEQFAQWMKQKHPRVELMRDAVKTIAEEYASSLVDRGVSANTYNKRIRFMKLFFRVLKDKSKFSENPWEDIQRKRQIPQSRRELTIDELRKIAELAQGELRTLLALGIYTGLRLGDCVTLRWGEIDLHRGIIRRIPNKTARRKPTPVIVPIHPALAAILEQIPKTVNNDYVLPQFQKLYEKRVHKVTDIIQDHFRSCRIEIHKPGTGKKTTKRAVVEVGFHSLRHTFVSLCREANAPLAVVESIVGHSNPAMTRHYTHLGEDAAISAVRLLPDVTDTTTLKEASEPDKVAKIRSLIESMNSRNWKGVKGEILRILT